MKRRKQDGARVISVKWQEDRWREENKMVHVFLVWSGRKIDEEKKTR